jgi:hypothetical protein
MHVPQLLLGSPEVGTAVKYRGIKLPMEVEALEEQVQLLCNHIT